MASIYEVARRAGVSPTTVSHVLNQTRAVRPDTRERVLAAVRELRFVPSSAARSLTTKRGGAIGVIISDIANPLFAEIVHGIQAVADRYGYNIILCNTDEQLEKEQRHLELLLRQRVDGIVAAATSRRWGQLDIAEALRLPVVFIDRHFEGITAPLIEVDNEGGAHSLVCHLLSDGHRRIGILAGLQRLSTMPARLAGYHRALREHGIEIDDALVRWGELSAADGYRRARELLALEPRPTAIVANNNLLALGLLGALRERRLRCPEDVGVVVFGDHPWSTIFSPPLTVARHPMRELGRRSADLLMRMIDGHQPDVQRTVLSTQLIVRASCSQACAARYDAAAGAALMASDGAVTSTG